MPRVKRAFTQIPGHICVDYDIMFGGRVWKEQFWVAGMKQYGVETDYVVADSISEVESRASEVIIKYYESLKTRKKVILYELDLVDRFQRRNNLVAFGYRLAYEQKISEISKVYIEVAGYEMMARENVMHLDSRERVIEWTEQNEAFCKDLVMAIQKLQNNITEFFGADGEKLLDNIVAHRLLGE